jgi:8-oxo-dGTP pyrophosphatase MutT (NUDIX family)
MSFEAIRAALGARVPGVAPVDDIAPEHRPRGGFARAAVLVALHEKGGTPHVLLTRRTRHLRRHAGQISFPGGRLDPEEDHLSAALREAREEIGLEPDRAEVLGRLSETLVLTSAFRLTPWVASVPYPYPYVAAPHEVEEILHVPLARLLEPGVHRAERREAYGMLMDVHYFTLGDETIWGATARILSELVAVWRAS